MGTPLIEVEGVTHAVRDAGGQSRPLLRGVDLVVHEGEFVAIMGANGSGKSTLVKHFNALLLPSEGKVRVQGVDTRDALRVWEVRQAVGMVFQNPDHQMVSPVVEEEVAFGLENLRVPSDEIRGRVMGALGQVGLDGLRLANPGHLSGGQKQRLAIASILAMRPRALVLDEPTAMLDPAGRRDVLEAVRRTREEAGISVILVTHSVEEARLADRVVLLEGGRIVRDGRVEEWLGDVRHMQQLGVELPPLAELVRLLEDGGMDVGVVPGSGTQAGEMILAALSRVRREVERRGADPG